MPRQFAKFIRRPFQSLFYSMEYYFKESKELYDKIHAQDPARPQDFDQHLWMKEKAAARAAFIMGMAAIEAFANNILRDFAVRGKKDLPESLLNKLQKKYDVNFWRLPDKTYFLPTLCNSQLIPPAFYFKRDSKEFQLFEEIVKIRNGIMHGRPEPFLVLIKFKPSELHEVNDNFPENFWFLSNIPKDFTSFNHQCASIAYDNIKWVRESLISFIEKVDEKYLKEEKIELISPIIQDNNLDEAELIRNWKNYINKS
jgi:hypothetical protein